VEEAKLLASDGTAGDYFGDSVAIWKDKVVVGAITADDSASGAGPGAAYVYRFDGTRWVEEAKLVPSSGWVGERFGGAVAISGRTIVVGASGNKTLGGNAGAAYVYRFDGTTWAEDAMLLPHDGAAQDQFGRSLVASGNAALVGSRMNDHNGPDSGAAYLFEGLIPPLAAEIDIRPGSDANRINPFSRGFVPVALLGSDTFDVNGVDPSTLAFGPDGAPPAFDLTDPLVHGLSYWDVNGDGRVDLLSSCRIAETGIAMGDTEACLAGETLDGVPFEGCDAVTTTTPPCGCGLGGELVLLLPLLVCLRSRR
jgi:hypothetical protein